MANQEVKVSLERCLGAAGTGACGQITEKDKLNYCSARESLCEELVFLLQEAVDMRWPFVPEKWQYKQDVTPNDKSNLSELIGGHLSQLLNVLEAAIVAREAEFALALLFLVDRFLYWTDQSGAVLKMSKLLHKRHPSAPVAPQLVIRQARVYLNSGKLQKAEYILSRLIINSGTTGCWKYHSESDRTLVQAVCLQIRGMILQKLGLWLEAAYLIWASLVGYYALPRPDKKGIGTSLGILANILLSMNDEDFRAFQTNPDVDLFLLGETSHRLLCAAKAAQMAVVYSQYTPLYVLTNVTAQGTCLLSYSFSVACHPKKRPEFLLKAKEAFEVGLLTNVEGQTITSKQELHTLIKAAYSLAVVHKWLDGPSESVTRATWACQEALTQFSHYTQADTRDRGGICAEIMRSVSRVKAELRVEPFVNSENHSFIPDSFRSGTDPFVRFTLDGFSKALQSFQKYHMSLCHSAEAKCESGNEEVDGARVCITAFGTTDCGTTDCNPEAGKTSGCDVSPLPERQCAKSLSSSWMKLSLTSSGSAKSAAVPVQDVGGATFLASQRPAARFSSSVSRGSEKSEMPESEIATAGSDLCPTDPPEDGLPRSLSQLVLDSSSLSNSFGSKSSWENILRSAGSHRSGKSTESSGSFFLMKTQDFQSTDPEYDPATGWEILRMSKSPETPNINNGNCKTTEPSTENSHGTPDELNQSPQTSNPRCNSCLKGNFLVQVASSGQYSLSRQDYQNLLAGVCHDCLLTRLGGDKTGFKLEQYDIAHNALHLKFSKASGLWTARETCAYVGRPMGLHGTHRNAIWIRFLHQEERLSNYVGKDYRKPTQIHFHLRDVERQMTAQYYVTEFNKRLYEKDIMAQMFFLPSEALLILSGDEIAGCVTVEPYMLGPFVKLTNNNKKKNDSLPATDYGLAFGHFTYLHSDGQDIVVDLQGWVTANGKGLTYLTDPQIHSTRIPRGPSNLGQGGIDSFLRDQHGPECKNICRLLNLPPLPKNPH
ncbi:alpha-protein kinase 1 [Stigmatopora argus]